jgi:hypothetical protein
MNNALLATLVAGVICAAFVHNPPPQKPLSVADGRNLVLDKTIRALNGIRTIKYRQTLSIDSQTSGTSTKLKYDMYIEFSNRYPVIGFRFHQDATGHSAIYDGRKLLTVDRKSGKRSLVENPGKSSFKSLTFLFNSIVTVRANLPAISGNGSIRKEIKRINSNGRDLYSVSFDLKNGALDRLGGIMVTDGSETWRYEILIDPATFIPVEVRQSDFRNKDHYVTTFSDVELDGDYGHLITIED